MSSEDAFNKILDALSKKVGISREKLVEILASKLVEPRFRSIDVLDRIVGKRFFDSDVTINDIFKYRLMERLMGDGDIDLNKVLAIALIRQMLQPDMTTLLLLERLGRQQGSGGEDRVLQLLLQQQQQQQQLVMTLLTTILGRKTEELVEKIASETRREREELKREFDEKIRKLAEQMAKDLEEVSKDREQLINYLRQLNEKIMSQPQGPSLLLKLINEYRELQEALKNAAEALGIKKEEIPVKPTGEIDWGALLNRVLDIAEKYVETKARLETPVQQPMQVQGEKEVFEPLPEQQPGEEQAGRQEETGGETSASRESSEDSSGKAIVVGGGEESGENKSAS